MTVEHVQHSLLVQKRPPHTFRMGVQYIHYLYLCRTEYILSKNKMWIKKKEIWKGSLVFVMLQILNSLANKVANHKVKSPNFLKGSCRKIVLPLFDLEHQKFAQIHHKNATLSLALASKMWYMWDKTLTSGRIGCVLFMIFCC